VGRAVAAVPERLDQVGDEEVADLGSGTIAASADDMARARASIVRSGRSITLRCMDRMRTAARVGQREPNRKPTRFCQRIPRVMPLTWYGPTPLLTATRLTRLGSRHAQASAYGPPPDEPATQKRENPSLSAASATSAGQSVRARPGWTSDKPRPGRSSAITRNPAAAAAEWANCLSSREPGWPWK
jgi:hypothetical protein